MRQPNQLQVDVSSRKSDLKQGILPPSVSESTMKLQLKSLQNELRWTRRTLNRIHTTLGNLDQRNKGYNIVLTVTLIVASFYLIFQHYYFVEDKNIHDFLVVCIVVLNLIIQIIIGVGANALSNLLHRK